MSSSVSGRKVRRRRMRWQGAARIAGSFAALVVLGVAHLSSIGFPRFVSDKFVRMAGDAGIFAEFESIKLDVARGVVFEKPRLYVKGTFGPAFFEANRLLIRPSVAGGGHGVFRWINSLNVTSGTLRPEQMKGLGRKKLSRDARMASLRVVFDGLDVLELSFARFSCVVVVDGRRVGLEEISSWLGKGQDAGPLGGSFSYFGESGCYSGQVVSGFDPLLLCPFLRKTGLPGLGRFVGTFGFPEMSPSLRVSFSGNTRDGSVDVTGFFEGRNFRYNDVPVSYGQAPVRVEVRRDRQMVTLDTLVVKRPEGYADVRLEVDLEKDQVAFEGISSIHAMALAGLISRKAPGYIDSFRFGGPVKLCARGVVNYNTLSPFEVEARVEAESLGLWHFETEKCEFAFLRREGATTISDLTAELCGGRVSGWAYFRPDSLTGDPVYRASCRVEDASLRAVAESLVGELPGREGYSGRLWGKATVQGVAQTGAWGTVSGAGSISVSHGNILRLPLFGGLSELLVKLVPGLGYVLKQTDAKTEFTVERGIMRSKDLRIEGDVLSLRSEGSYSLVDNGLNFNVELRFLRRKTFVGGVLQTIFMPVSKMFKVKLSGTVDDPRWRTVNF